MSLSEQHLNLARSMARKAVSKKHKVGAVIAKKDFIIACGRNRPTPLNHTHWRGICAEGDALSKTRSDTKGATIYVCVLTKSDHDACSRPCDRCWELLKKAGIKWVVYSDRGVIKKERVYQ